MKTNRVIELINIALMMIVGCGAPATPTSPAAKLRVTSFSPIDGELDGDDAVRIQFDRPVVEDEAVGASLEDPPISLEPSAKTAAMWEDRQTLVVSSVDRLTPSTRYTVRLSGELATRTEEEEHSFVYKPLRVERASGTSRELTDTNPRIEIGFNQEVRAADIVAGCAIADEDGRERIPVTSPDREAVSTSVVLSPSRPLGKGVEYELKCAGISGAAGDEPMAEPWRMEFSTHPDFAVVDFNPQGEDVWSDEVQIELRFATPVDGEKLKEALASRPAIPELKRGTMTGNGRTFRAVVNLRSSTAYTVELDGSFEDAFGQKPARDLMWSFTTGEARPTLEMETGIFAVEAGHEGGAYPVWTRNISKFSVDCASVPKGKVVALLTGDMNYDPWYDAGSSVVDWKSLGLKKRTREFSIKEVKDKWRLKRVDLKKFCGGGLGGLFLAEMGSDEIEPEKTDHWRYRPNRRVLANVTNLGVLLKAGSSSGLAWVTALDSGKPVEGATVSIYSPRGARAFKGKTDSDGILRIPGADELLKQPGAGDKDEVEDEWGYEEYDTWRSRRLIAVVEKDGDMAVLDGNWANGIQIWNFGVQADYRGGETRYRGFILSDRGIYRPGEEVHFKGLIREVALTAPPRVPSARRVQVHVEDSRGSAVLDRRLELSDFGGFAFDLGLGELAPVGDYFVTATYKGQVFRETFIVEEFRKATFEVELTAGTRNERLGRALKFDMAADYFFGAPVKGAEVSWEAMRRPHMIYFERFPEYSFSDNSGSFGCWGGYWDDWGYSSSVASGEGRTDSSGRFRFKVVDEDKSLDGPMDYIVYVTALDATGEAISKRQVVTAHRSDVYVGLHAQEWVQAVGMPFSVNTVALSPDGEQVGLKGTLSYVKEIEECAYNAKEYRSYPTCKTRHETVWSRQVDIPERGTGAERIMPKEPGEYVIRLEGVDSRGRKVAASRFVWVLGKGEAFWSGDESARMSLVASKSAYEPGEIARLAPMSSLGPSTALVTLERNGVLEAFAVGMESAGQGIEIPIDEALAPNVYASVAMVKGRTGDGDRQRPRFQMGVAELKVSAKSREIEVEVVTEKATYRPREKVRARIRTVSAAGGPVKAEVAVSVADEGVLKLVNYKTPNPMDTFYKPWGLGVDSSTNLNRIARLNDPRYLDPDEGGDSGDGEGPDIRSRFVSSAFFAPSIVTDENGEAALEFEAPDNLTAFRIMAVAADAGSRFGAGEKRITISKPLLAKPLLPRFLSSGDEAHVGVDIKNLSGRSGEVTVSAKARGCKLKKSESKIHLEKGGSAQVRFPAVALMAKEATFTFQVEMGDLRDALRVSVPVARPLVYNRETVSKGAFQGDVAVPLRLGDGIVKKESRLEIFVDRTGMAELGPGLKHLIEYPYGCLEQTMSRLIPLLKVKDLAESLELKELKGPKLKKFIELGIAKVLRHQHEDGLFSLWPGGQTYPHLSVYALFGLNEARRSGAAVDEGALSRGAAAVKDWVNSGGGRLDSLGDLGTQAMASYVLAELGMADPGLTSRLFEKRAGLPIYGKAFLLMAMSMGKADSAEQTILKHEILSALRLNGDSAAAEEPDRSGSLGVYMSSNVRTSAIVMSALLKADPQSDFIPKLAEGLRRSQLAAGRWRTTQDNLYAIVALSEYARLQAQGSAAVSVSLGAKRIAKKTLKGHEVLSLDLPIDDLEPGDLVISSRGPARHAVRLVEAELADNGAPKSNGFSVTRQYLNPESGTPVERVKVGDMVKVRVSVTTDGDRDYVAVADRLPAGLEPINTRLDTNASPDESSSRYPYFYNGWTYTELRDEEVRAFQDSMSRGSHVLEYMARAITPGTFAALPAAAEEMYAPEVNGRGEVFKLEVAQ